MSEVNWGDKCCLLICVISIIVSFFTDPLGLILSVPGLILFLMYHYFTRRRNSSQIHSRSFNQNNL